MKIRIKLLGMACILGISLLTSTSVSAKNNINIHRLSGADRYGTSLAIVSQGWTQSNYAILVNSQNFPDAITASPLAKKYNAPILLTDPSTLTDSTKQELQSLGVKNVFIIGGVGVVSSDVENQLETMGISVKRLWGQDRYETSINVAKEIGSSKGVFIVNGEHYEDALSVAPIADKLQYPIVLVEQDTVPDMVKNYVNNQVKANGGEVDIVGGQDVLTDNVTSILNPTEVYNQSTKYDRNLALINSFKGQLDLSKVYIASDKGFTDALSGSALAGQNGNPIILVGDSNQSNLNSFISNNNVSNVNVIGGTGVLSDNTVDNITGETGINSDNGNDSNNSESVSNKNIVSFGANITPPEVSELIVTGAADPNAVMVVLKLDVSDPASYTVIVKGVTATFNPTTNLFVATVYVNSNINKITFNESDFIITNNSTKATSPTISEINNTNASVDQYDIYSLPSTVQATMSDGSIQQVAVAWYNKVDTSQAGTFTFNGTVHGYSGNVVLTLNVKATINKVINFPDKNLELVIRDAISKPTGDIYKSDVEKMTSLDSSYHLIKNISGIENLTNLQTLSLDGNQISDISALQRLTNLQSLSLHDNKISDISALQGLIHLQTLFLSYNEISDISALQDLTDLQWLSLDFNKISDIGALKELTNLQVLQLDDNAISNIDALKGLTKLQDLGISDNAISYDYIKVLKNALPNCKVKF